MGTKLALVLQNVKLDVLHRLKPVDSNSVAARQQENRVEVHGSQTGERRGLPVLSPPVRRRCCVRRSRRHCTAPRCRRRTGKPLGSCGFPARYARSESIVATYTLLERIQVAPRLCASTDPPALPT